MAVREFPDAALVLLGHGTAKNAGSAATVRTHARALRAGGHFARVAAAFWKQEPQVERVLRVLREPRIFLVPFFATAGYFTEEVIPERLGFGRGPDGRLERCRVVEGRTWFFTEPVGTHDRLTDLLLEQAAGVVRQHPFPVRPDPSTMALILVGHGTLRSGRARREVEARAEALRQQGGYAEVHAVYLEEEPGVGEACRLAAATNLVVVPLFLSDGLHAAEDVPILLGEPEDRVRRRLEAGLSPWRNPTERHGKRVWYAPSIGGTPAVRDLILERVRERVRA